jgi:hypothetical protein
MLAGAHGLRVIMPGLGCPLVHVLVFLLFWICSMICLPEACTSTISTFPIK